MTAMLNWLPTKKSSDSHRVIINGFPSNWERIFYKIIKWPAWTILYNIFMDYAISKGPHTWKPAADTKDKCEILHFSKDMLNDKYQKNKITDTGEKKIQAARVVVLIDLTSLSDTNGKKTKKKEI